ncbi:AlwI family type II restriction endonuclease [Konateibacter massiliensis]|uniref:AlwI family type II restriction endonuclease n=1 Tax=Konateibacter massiliensis TaxID=2002841 RepID=UPI000C15AA65|nr:AlwI family type II restriction endonuclease [Konateibacter massiliensis]
MTWSWRTKPRSIIKTIQWFPYFAALKGKNWEQKEAYTSKIGKPIHAVRRAYIYSAHGEDDSWLSSISYQDYLRGQKDTKETESNGRNDKTTFEFFGFGYVNQKGEVCVTEVGEKIVRGTFDSEDYLKQLLKLKVPNLTYKKVGAKGDKGVFPFKIILRAFEQFDSLNRSELALLFGCTDDGNIDAALNAIAKFKEDYEKLPNKNDTGEVRALFETIFIKYYGSMSNKAASYYDYAEALSRTLLYTGLFNLSGRSIASKVRVAEHSKSKVKMLQEKFTFLYPDNFNNIEEYMTWYGSTGNIVLPWENAEERRSIISDKAKLLLEKVQSAEGGYEHEAELSVQDIEELVRKSEKSASISDLKVFEATLSNAIVSHNEEHFIKVLSKTEQERANIMEKFNDILDNDDMSALWLEVNTWKSLIAIDGEQVVKRNFKIEDDLTPRSFAPGVGNTPDMELYKNGYIIIPEVSLMTGVRQWEHEASSVIDHVLSFIKEYEDKQVIGLFLSSRINVRTFWQFFILNRESWMGYPVPVVPLTIEQYMDILKFIYDNSLDIDAFKQLLELISGSTLECSTYSEWEKGMKQVIDNWKKENAN